MYSVVVAACVRIIFHGPGKHPHHAGILPQTNLEPRIAPVYKSIVVLIGPLYQVLPSTLNPETLNHVACGWALLGKGTKSPETSTCRSRFIRISGAPNAQSNLITYSL